MKNFKELLLGRAEAVDEWEAALLSPRATLHCLHEGHAVFIEVAEGAEAHVHASAFLYEAQLNLARRVYFVPVRCFYELAAKLGPPGCRCLVISSTGRTGSTLLSAMLGAHSAVTTLSEPWALGIDVPMLLARPEARAKQLGQWLQEEPSKVVRAVVAVQLKELGESTLAVIKLHSQGLSLVPLLKRCFPEQLHLYLYRDPRATVDSLIRMEDSMLPPPIRNLLHVRIGRRLIIEWLLPIAMLSRAHERFYYTNLMDDDVAWARERKAQEADRASRLVLFWASNVRAALQLLREEKLPGMVSVHYDAILADRIPFITRLFRFCGLDAGTDVLEAVLAATERDSQEDSVLSKTRTGERRTSHTSGQIQRYNEWFEQMGVPCFFDGTLALPLALLPPPTPPLLSN